MALGARVLAVAALTLVLAAPATARVRIDAKPSLTPAFRTSVTDYASRCGGGRPLRLAVDAGDGASVSVDGRAERSGSFDAVVELGSGQATRIEVRSGGRTTRHHVRCLPSRFPRWRFRRFARPQAQWYLMAPAPSGGPGPVTGRVIVFDRRGVPVWWRRGAAEPFNSTLLPDGTLAWTRWLGGPFGVSDEIAWEVRRLDGTLVRTLRTVGSPTDTHDMQPLANGNFLLETYPLRRDVDLRPYGGSGRGDVIDGEIQELTPSGRLVWRWRTRDHLRPSETDWPPPKRTFDDGTVAYDVVHLNSMEPDRDGGLVISVRHTNAVYGIDRDSGKVTWKLGGTKRKQSLRVVDDPRKPTFGRQHDARVLPDGTVTVYDNRSRIGSPRAVRFRIDPARRRARRLGQATDEKARESVAQGSARLLPGGNWVVSWGGTKLLSEISPSNRPVWRLDFRDEDVFNYRVTPIPRGRLGAFRLRRGMDAMHPRRP